MCVLENFGGGQNVRWEVRTYATTIVSPSKSKVCWFFMFRPRDNKGRFRKVDNIHFDLFLGNIRTPLVTNLVGRYTWCILHTREGSTPSVALESVISQIETLAFEIKEPSRETTPEIEVKNPVIEPSLSISTMDPERPHEWVGFTLFGYNMADEEERASNAEQP